MAFADKQMSILIVDDKFTMRRTIRNLLQRLGYQNFLEADDGDTALGKLHTNKVDLVLCDWNMPRMNGLELLRTVREDHNLKDLPFLMVTAEMNEGQVAEAGEEDVDAYVLKPFTPAILQEKIESALRHRNKVSPIDTHLEVGNVLMRSRQFDNAMAEYRAALQINPNSPRALLAVGTAYEAKEQRQEAKEYYLQAAKLAPLFLKAHEALAMLAESQNDLVEASVHWQRAVDISPRKVERQISLGKALLSSGKLDEAARVFENVMKLAQENHAEVAALVGDIYLEAGMGAEASHYLQEGLNFNPNDVHLYNRLGIALRKQERCQEAVENYQRALKIEPENENLYFNLGRAYFEAGDLQKAEAAMRKALQIFPQLSEAKTFLGKVLQKPLA